jgi:hypothetical protein
VNEGTLGNWVARAKEARVVASCPRTTTKSASGFVWFPPNRGGLPYAASRSGGTSMRLMRKAPISREMILNYVARHSLGLPSSY